MTQKETDEMYMRRCLQLAVNGRLHAKPNPMVGAVIVSGDGRIIGEGWHRVCGQGHAEVNAFASVKPEDEPLLSDATIYVSLEPCSHWGKTPPCADLIVHKGVRRCVCGCIDPFARVKGHGVERLREAGIEVTVGVREQECLDLNRRFVTVQTLHRPYILLKWAQTANGIIGLQGARLQISTPFTAMLVHKMRADVDAIVIGRNTLEADHPQLTTRLWSGPSPVRYVLTSAGHLVPEGFEAVTSVDDLLARLTTAGCQSLLVEGGAATLQSFIDRGLWDEARIEEAPFTVPADVRAPHLPDNGKVENRQWVDGRLITVVRRHDSI